ncbi:MAG: prephenate dehydratase [Actinomycetia bacterium]|nr:prephenate dehydratase [Actinomycetes bacterium]
MATFAYLGPRATFSDEVAHLFARQLGASCVEAPEFVACATIEEVFAKVDAGDADFGVAPIENSLEGSVNTTLDELASGHAVSIIGEKILAIHHALVATAGTTLADINTLLSYPSAMERCARWTLRTLPGRPVLAVASAGDAVRLAVERQGYGAIATEFAAGVYEGEIIEDNIEDTANNLTSYLLIAGEGVAATWREAAFMQDVPWKTSVALFQVDDKPGSLLLILSEFAQAGINLTKIQSRPTRQVMGEYMFFLDFEGRQDDPKVKAVLDSLRAVLREVKVLGSYPAA